MAFDITIMSDLADVQDMSAYDNVVQQAIVWVAST